MKVTRVFSSPGGKQGTGTFDGRVVLQTNPTLAWFCFPTVVLGRCVSVSQHIPTAKHRCCVFVPQLAKRSGGGGGGGGRGRNGGRGSAGSAPAHGSLPVMTDRSMSMSSGGGGEDSKGRKQKTDRDRERDRGGVGGGGGGSGVAGDAAVKAPPGKKSRKGIAGWRGEREREGGTERGREVFRYFIRRFFAFLGAGIAHAGSKHAEGKDCFVLYCFVLYCSVRIFFYTQREHLLQTPFAEEAFVFKCWESVVRLLVLLFRPGWLLLRSESAPPLVSHFHGVVWCGRERGMPPAGRACRGGRGVECFQNPEPVRYSAPAPTKRVTYQKYPAPLLRF